MFAIDAVSGEPPFEQLRRQVAEQIRQGQLEPGDRLPTVRKLADDLGIAPNTVARAYRELEAEWLVVGRGRAGTFVADGGAEPVTAEALEHARRAAEAYARTVRALRVETVDAIELVRDALRA